MKAVSAARYDTIGNLRAMTWLRRYFIAVGLIALGCAWWKFQSLIHSPGHFGPKGFGTWVLGIDSGSYLLTLALLLFPWWRLGGIPSALGYAIALPCCVYFLGGLSAVDMIYLHRQTLFHGFLLSGVLAQAVWAFLSFQAESRQAAMAHLWKERMRKKHLEKVPLVDRFILEVEGEDKDATQWGRFAKSSDPNALWKAMDAEWENWIAQR
jgi:hypothetical protein